MTDAQTRVNALDLPRRYAGTNRIQYYNKKVSIIVVINVIYVIRNFEINGLSMVIYAETVI